MSCQMEYIKKEICYFQETQMEILELKSTTNEIKNPLKVIKSNRCELAKETINELEDRILEIMQSKTERNKKEQQKTEVDKIPLSIPTYI